MKKLLYTFVILLVFQGCSTNKSFILKENNYYKVSPPDSVEFAVELFYQPTIVEGQYNKQLIYYKNGVRYKATLYDPSGAVKKINTYSSDGKILEGIVLRFRDNMLYREYTVDNWKLNGEFVEYDNKGNLKYIYLYSDNILKQIVYSQDGNYNISDSTFVPVILYSPEQVQKMINRNRNNKDSVIYNTPLY